jgi:hypothetical protein
MKYEEIYSRFYLKETDPSLFKLSKEDAYERMCGWLHSVAAIPHVRKCFSTLTFNDELEELTFSLTHFRDEDSDKDFVIEVFAQGMVISWMRPQIEKNINLAVVIGGKEEKSMLNNYKNNIARLETLEKNLKKFIRDYGYLNNDYIGAE